MATKEKIVEDRQAEAQPVVEPKPEAGWVDVKSEVARRLIDAMEKGETPWQKPWSSPAMQPKNPVTGNGYRGINRVLLSLAGGNGLWVTYQQAQAQGWQVRKGEKGTMIVKVVDLDQQPKQKGEAVAGDRGEKDKDYKRSGHRNVILRRYYVFGAHQIDGMPELEPTGALDFHPVERAESVIEAMKRETGLMIIHGGDRACYVPALDEVRIPPKRAFKTEYDYYSTACHEICHSTMHTKRLNRAEAYAKKWGDSAYGLEELTAEIGAAILASETGLASSEELAAAHLEDHAKYLRGWIKAIERDPMAIFTAAKNAEKISEYVLGLERQMTALDPHKEWIEEYERAKGAR